MEGRGVGELEGKEREGRKEKKMKRERMTEGDKM